MHLTDEDQANMLELFTAFADGKGTAMAEATLKFSGSSQACPDPQAFVAAIDKRFREIEQANAYSKTSNGAEALASLLEIIRQYQVTPAEI